MSGLLPGAQVRHGRWGIGTLIGVSHDGLQAQVFFRNIEQKKTVQLSELTQTTAERVARPSARRAPDPPITASTSLSAAAAPTSEQDTAAASAIEAPAKFPEPRSSSVAGRRLVETLRQGLPPADNIMGWTVGLEAQVAQLHSAFLAAREGRGALICIEADYGQGKTHFGRIACALARECGFASSTVELDGDRLSCANPGGVVGEFLRNTTIPSETTGLCGLPVLLAAIERRGMSRRMTRLAELQHFLPAVLGNDAAMAALESYLAVDLTSTRAMATIAPELGWERWKIPQAMLPMHRVNQGTVAARASATIAHFDSVAGLARDSGTKGFVCVLDEFDHDVAKRGTHASRVRAGVEVLAQGALGAGVVLLVLTTRSAASASVTPQFSRLSLPPVSSEAALRMVEKTAAAHSDAFGVEYRADGVSELGVLLWGRYVAEYEAHGWGPRYFVRATLEACDRACISGSLTRGLKLA